MKEVKAAMEKYPDLFEVTEWKALNHAKGWEIIAGPYFMDGGQQDTAAMKEYGEPKELLTRFIIKENKRCKDYTISEAWDKHIVRDQYRADYYNYLTSHPKRPDVILCPAGPRVAPKLDMARYWGYTSIWNLLDCPAAIFPVSFVKDKEDSIRGPFLGEEYEGTGNNVQFFLGGADIGGT